MHSLFPTSFLTAATTFAIIAASLAGDADRAPSHAAPTPAEDSHFLESSRCAECHSTAATANALWSRTGDDVSPYATWNATMMANAFRDPYWRAQVRKEVSAAADDAAGAAIEALCVKCHAPMVHHDARLAGRASPGVFASAGEPLAEDGVSCTVCHQATGEGFGTEASFSGDLDIGTERKIFGPYPDPAGRPMLMHTGYTATHGAHIEDPGLCATCHTLFTHHAADGSAFSEQAPFLEWRNSVFADPEGEPDSARTCQECHMPEVGTMRIARNPAGRDFNIPLREGFRAHTFIGGNAFMLDLMRRNAAELGVTADADALKRNARATRAQLAQLTADLEILDAELAGGELSFALLVRNRTGHKFPTGYPARRAWLHVQVRAGRTLLWESGRPTADGRIVGIGDERGQPHHTMIREPSQVQVYETVAADADGAPTTYLTRMVRTTKDNRLLPRGWRADGQHAETTAPVGIDGDADFRGGEDRVAFRIALDEARSERLTVVAWLLYQPVPPAWVDPLRAIEGDEPAAFVRMYDGAEKTPETVAVTVAVVGG